MGRKKEKETIVLADGEEICQEKQKRGRASPAVIGGAALVGAGVGAIISGPTLAVPLGVAAAGLCLRDDEVGDMARATGKAGAVVAKKGKEVNEKYQVTNKVKKAAQSTYKKGKEIDKDKDVSGTTKKAASRGWFKLKKVNKERKGKQSAAEAFGESVETVENVATMQEVAASVPSYEG